MIDDTGKEGAVFGVRVLRSQDGWVESSGKGVKKEKRRMSVDTDTVEVMKRSVRRFLPNGL